MMSILSGRGSFTQGINPRSDPIRDCGDRIALRSARRGRPASRSTKENIRLVVRLSRRFGQHLEVADAYNKA